MDTLEIQLLCMNSNADIVLCQSFAELHATRSCLLHELIVFAAFSLRMLS